MKKLLVEVISSWQVITVTVVLIIYIFIVRSVARLYHRRRIPKQSFAPSVPETPNDGGKSAVEIVSESDELNLEEEEEK